MTAHSKPSYAPLTDDPDRASLNAIRGLLAGGEQPAAKTIPTPAQAAPAVAPQPVAPPAAPMPLRIGGAATPKPVLQTASPAPEAATVAQPQPAPQKSTPVPPKVPAQDAAAQESSAQDVVRKVMEADTAEAEQAEAAERNAQPFADRIKAKITGYRPKPKHILIAGALLLVVFRPWLVVGLLLLSLFVMGCVFLILGYDGFWRTVLATVRWRARRNPARAAHLHRRLDNFAMKFDAFLDRFPEGSVDGLYLPDFQELAQADAKHDAAMERRLAEL